MREIYEQMARDYLDELARKEIARRSCRDYAVHPSEPPPKFKKPGKSRSSRRDDK